MLSFSLSLICINVSLIIDFQSERIVIKLKECVEKLREESSDIIELGKLARADSIISDVTALCESEPTEVNWDITIAAAKLREIQECINGRPISDNAQPPSIPKMSPYCFRCDSEEHATEACPLQNGAKPKAEPCGFAVDGLGFYHIPHSEKPISKLESEYARVKVIKGQMSAAQVTYELQRLVPDPDNRNWKWEVEESGENSFTTTFPSKMDLQRMVLWGPVKTKCTKAKMVIEEWSKSEEDKYGIPKVWVQFRGLSEGLREHPIIWAVGSILGVTCGVDMAFTTPASMAELD